LADCAASLRLDEGVGTGIVDKDNFFCYIYEYEEGYFNI